MDMLADVESMFPIIFCFIGKLQLAFPGVSNSRDIFEYTFLILHADINSPIDFA
jgi:hypothetical protein